MHWIAVALGGSLGAVLRYSLSQWIVRKFPMGTFVVNIVGCFLIGLLIALAVKTKWPGPTLQAFLIGGVLGSLTTFSTFAYQTVELGQQHSLTYAATNLIANLVIGLILVGCGIALGEFIGNSIHSGNEMIQ